MQPTPSLPPISFPIDFVAIRKAFAREIQKVTALSQNQVVLAEPETQNEPRPQKPYFSFKFNTPAAKIGDDTKSPVPNPDGTPSTIVNSGGVRMMTIGFDCYGNTHEEAYNYMSLWQTALDLPNIQADLRLVGVAVWQIETVADLSALLNTGYEGRAHLDVHFGIAMNLTADLGAIETVNVQGQVTTDQGNVVGVSVTATETDD